MFRCQELCLGLYAYAIKDDDLVDLHGSRCWAYYTLNVPAEATLLEAALETDEEKILAYVREHGSINNTECRDLFAVSLQQASYLL
jgi:hypothetical protein